MNARFKLTVVVAVETQAMMSAGAESVFWEAEDASVVPSTGAGIVLSAGVVSAGGVVPVLSTQAGNIAVVMVVAGSQTGSP